jgi:hypothetical protein
MVSRFWFHAIKENGLVTILFYKLAVSNPLALPLGSVLLRVSLDASC